MKNELTLKIKYKYSETEGVKISSDLNIEELKNEQLINLRECFFDETDKIFKKIITEKRNMTLEEKVIVESLIYWINYTNKNIKEDQHLYLLFSKTINCFKIGITNDIEKRIKDISRDMCLTDIELIFLKQRKSHLEKILHKKFSKLNKKFIGKYKSEHKEWFQYSEDIINKFKEI